MHNREIERKFLVNDKVKPIINECIHTINIMQGYLSKDPERIVRIRHISESYDLVHGEQINPFKCGVITIKTKLSEDTAEGVDEYEYKIPALDGLSLLHSCFDPIIAKTRYIKNIKNQQWEIDVFKGHKNGLILAEIELKSMNIEIELPEWIEKEVTGDPAYSNSNL
jgi:adenylate cyclase